MATALIQLGTDSDAECRGWETLSGSAVTQVVITASQGCLIANRDARNLYDLLLLALRRAGARPEPTRCGGNFGPGADGCWASTHPGAVRRVLVWVADATCASPHVGYIPHRAAPWNVVLPLLPSGVAASSLPAGLNTVLAHGYTPGKPADAVPSVLMASGLCLEEFRIFISYRWDDAGAVAQQLFDALSREQFDVYLDRFRTNPGTNFLERIRFELADKACVLLLDSRYVGGSPWVRGEYAFARNYKLGLIAIDLPGGSRTFRRIGTRYDLSGAASSGSFGGSSLLPHSLIDQAAAFVRDRYHIELARRFRHQRRLIRSAAKAVGVSHNLRADGHFDIVGAGRSYVVCATARPPSLGTFRNVCEAAGTMAKGVVVGPMFARSHSAHQDLDWLARESRSVMVDERRLFKAIRRIAAGHL